jgi:tetratricopeptide (TPR) repeat protein
MNQKKKKRKKKSQKRRRQKRRAKKRREKRRAKKKKKTKNKEKKEVGAKVEGEVKEEKKEPKMPREPEPKIPTDYTELINEINKKKDEGNEEFKKGSIEGALSKYKEAYEKLEKEWPNIDKERDYNPQSSELLTLLIKLSQNLSLCYFKLENYEESIKLDQQIIARDKNYDKSYARLFQSYLKQGKKQQAVYFGIFLLGFDEETKKKYEKLIPEIEEAKKDLQAEYDAIRAKERKEMLKSFAKYAIPIVILIAAFAIYFFVFKKKKIAQ